MMTPPGSNLMVTDASVTINQSTILSDVSAEFAGGQVTAIIGPNGAGKSTLLAVAAGERHPDSGQVRIGGENIRRHGSRHLARRRAVMPQNTTVAFPFTVREVVAMGRTAWDSTAADNLAVVDRVLAMTSLASFADREITTLSGGERQRVAFTRILAQVTPVTASTVILLDEPTSAMDISHAEATLGLVRTLARQGAAVGVVVHDLDAAAAYADQLVLMNQGRIERSGTVREVCTSDLLSAVYGTPIDVIEHHGRLLIAPGRHHLASGMSR